MNELKIAGIPFATWVQIITTIATVVGAFSVVHAKLELATSSVQELKVEIKELKNRELQNEKTLGTIPAELKYLDHRISNLEASKSRVP
jgi:hypothetical protein